MTRPRLHSVTLFVSPAVPLLGLFGGALRPAFVPLRPALYNNALP